MKLLFFNGVDEKADNRRMQSLNQAIHSSGMTFDFFRSGETPIRNLNDLLSWITKDGDSTEPVIAMLHYTKCSDFSLDFTSCFEGLKNRLIVVLFSGDPLDLETVESFVVRGKAGGIAEVFWLEKGYNETIVRPEFVAFFKWLSNNTTQSVEVVLNELRHRLNALNEPTSSQPDPAITAQESVKLLLPLLILCEGALAVFDIESGKCVGHVPAGAIKQIKSPGWWKEGLTATSHKTLEGALLQELNPRLSMSVEKLPPDIGDLLNAIFSKNEITESMVKKARDYCHPLVC